MIKIVTGNLFESDADCLVNTVNCEGVMGKGIAYQFKLRFPENYKAYVSNCKEGKLRPGKMLVFSENDKTIINFPTKDKWRNPSLIGYISDGLDELMRIMPDLKAKKIAMPPLGCGNGGLDWEAVKPLIEKKLQSSDTEIELYAPSEGVNKRDVVGQRTVNDLLLLYARQHLMNANSLRFQKTFYFANYYYGKKLFGFERGRYGPYSKALYNTADELGRYQKKKGLSDAKSTYDAIYRVICSKETDKKLEKMTDALDKSLRLVNKTEDNLVLEGAATALFLIKDEKIIKTKDILKAFKEWSDDKAARFNEEVVLNCLDELEHFGMVRKNLFEEYEII